MEIKNIEHIEKDFLNSLLKNKTVVTVYLINGICLTSCVIKGFDSNVLVIKDVKPEKETVTLMVYKKALSTIVPKD